MVVSTLHLPPYPSSHALRSLPPSQRSALLNKIVSALSTVLSIPEDTFKQHQHSSLRASTQEFVASYARECACGVLAELVYGDEYGDGVGSAADASRQEKQIRGLTLRLAHRLALLPSSGSGLALQTLFDLAITYGTSNVTRTRALLTAAFSYKPPSNPISATTTTASNHLLHDLAEHALPSFTSLLTRPDSGLHALRKTTFTLTAFLRCAPAEAVRVFARGARGGEASSREFVFALARCYDWRLGTLAAGYGGIDIDGNAVDGEAKMLIACKVDLLDTFQIIVQHLLETVTSDPVSNTRYTLELFVTLLEMPSSSTSNTPTPFLNRSLLQDYTQTYPLASTLASVFANVNDANDRAKLQMLDQTLRISEASSTKDSGALRILLRSSGLANRASAYTTKGKGKDKHRTPTPPIELPSANHPAVPASPSNPTVSDSALSTLLDIFPDQSPIYLRALLGLPQYGGDAEKVVDAVLSGEAPGPDEVQEEAGDVHPEKVGYVNTANVEPERVERRNVFDEERIDLGSVTVGKR